MDGCTSFKRCWVGVAVVNGIVLRVTDHHLIVLVLAVVTIIISSSSSGIT